MIDPLLGLSFNIHAQQGTYALLLGSGVSRSANIPTGWEVILDLVAKLARLENEETKGRDVDWFTEKFGKEPDYPTLLSAVAPTSAAQQQLLKSYFEPTQDERERGEKLPTKAHEAIAKLVRSGRVRVIITTNFDRLLEAALEAEGVAPVVIAPSDAAQGAPPIAHSKCTIVKVHGDYLDHRIRNSPEALAHYDPAIERLLDQIFDEYGLIVVGWSGDYDVALRQALERSRSRRYPLYWAGLSEPAGVAKELVGLHRGVFIRIDGADSFFASLVEKVETLEEFNRPHPITTQSAIITLKRYLSEHKFRIQLRDFLIDEGKQARSAVVPALEPIQKVTPNQEATSALMKRLEAACEKLIHIFANGSFYAGREQAKGFFDAYELVLQAPPSGAIYEIWINFQKYPALLLAYAAGICAVTSENYSVLSEIASRASFIKHDGEKSTVAPVRIQTHEIMRQDAARKLIPEMERRHTPFSDYLLKALREPTAQLIPDDSNYQKAFDNFEYLWCLLHVDAKLQSGASHIWTPFGAFCWRRKDDSDWFRMSAKKALESKDASWAPLTGGLFGGSLERLAKAVGTAQPLLDRIAGEMW